MWTFKALNLHQLTDSKVQRSIKKVNNLNSNDIVRSYQEDIEVNYGKKGLSCSVRNGKEELSGIDDQGDHAWYCRSICQG